MASSQDACYLSLLGLAEYFRTSNPPNIKKCIQSLQALFTFKPPLKVEARTHLQMGQILFAYTKNVDLARGHLEQAWKLSESINGFDDVKFDAASLMAKLFQEQKQSALAKPILRRALQISQHNVYWHCRLLFQLAQLHASDREYSVASELLALGVESTEETNSTYLKVLFLLSRAMMLMIDRKMNEVLNIFHQASIVIENSIQNLHLKEYLKVFYLVLQVCYYLSLGQMKTVKPNLKQLQQSIQSIMAPDWPSDESIFGQNGQQSLEMFMWLPKEQLCVLVYLVSVSHSMMTGYMDKAQKYTENALDQIEKLRTQENKPILSVFQVILYEHIVMCRLIMGNKTAAIKEIALAREVCLSSPDKTLITRHSAQLHCLIGLYSMSITMFEQGERHLLCCIQETHDRDLKLFANLNLSIIYLRTKRENDLRQILDTVSSENSQCLSSQALMGCFYYVQGLNSFHKNSFHDSKRFLRETLKMANAEDLNRLTSCSLVLLSHVFLSIGNSKDCMNMVTPAMQLASKIPDIHVQLWGSAILKDLHRMSKEVHKETEAYNNHVAFSRTLLADQYNCTNTPEHTLLLNWSTNDHSTYTDAKQQPSQVQSQQPSQQHQQQSSNVLPSTSTYMQSYGV